MLSHYVVRMKELMNLSNMEMEQLRQTIRLGISDKYFGKHNIHVERNRIHSVEGLLWNNEKREFFINPELKPNSTRTYTRNKGGGSVVDPSEKDMIPQFGVKWGKYVESLDRKIMRNNRRARRVTVTQHGSHVKHLHLVKTPGSTTCATSTDATENTTDATTTDVTDDDE